MDEKHTFSSYSSSQEGDDETDIIRLMHGQTSNTNRRRESSIIEHSSNYCSNCNCKFNNNTYEKINKGYLFEDQRSSMKNDIQHMSLKLDKLYGIMMINMSFKLGHWFMTFGGQDQHR